MRPYLAALLVGAGIMLSGCAARSAAKPAAVTGEPVYPVSGVPSVAVNEVKRYRDGKIVDLNRLRVNWRANDKCKAINPKYGNTTERLVFDNIMKVLDRYPADGVFQDGFDFSDSSDIMNLDRDYRSPPVSLWSVGRPYIRESAESPDALMQLGNELFDNACNDPEKR